MQIKRERLTKKLSRARNLLSRIKESLPDMEGKKYIPPESIDNLEWAILESLSALSDIYASQMRDDANTRLMLERGARMDARLDKWEYAPDAVDHPPESEPAEDVVDDLAEEQEPAEDIVDLPAPTPKKKKK